MLAAQNEIVLVKHVELARDIINHDREKGWQRQLLIVSGATVFGAFIPGFIGGVSTGSRLLTVIYTALGMLGMLFVFLGLRR
ncbi:MAG TPA: hypothetical protein VF397_17570 [Pyrinomonadaceae bacterium]